MSTTYRIISSVAFVCLVAAGAQTGCGPQQQCVAPAVRVWPAEQTDPASARVRAKLQENQQKLDFADVPLEQVIEFMRDISGCSIDVRWNTLEAAGVNKDTPVNVKLTDVTIKKALRTILEDVGQAEKLGYVIDEGVVTICTRENLDRMTITRVYDASDLLGPQQWTAQDKAIVRKLLREGLSKPLKAKGEVFHAADAVQAFNGRMERLADALEMTHRRRRAEELADIIRTAVQPETWEPEGGLGRIRVFGKKLIISHSRSGHEEIVRLLAAMRGEAPASPEPAGAKWARASHPVQGPGR